LESEDNEIIRRIKNGDTEIYAMLVRKYHHHLLNFIFRIMRDQFIVEDIGQEVFISVYRSCALPLPCRIRSLCRGSLFHCFASLGFMPFSAVDAYRIAASKSEGYMVKAYNRWYVYLLLWCIGAFWMSGAFAGYVQRNILMFCHIATGSMEPAVTPGDYIIFDNTTGERTSPKKGAIVLFRYPDDRSKLYVKRLAGLPGDTLLLEGSAPVVVPHGYIFVLGHSISLFA
jgi:hypothetical protein